MYWCEFLADSSALTQDSGCRGRRGALVKVLQSLPGFPQARRPERSFCLVYFHHFMLNNWSGPFTLGLNLLKRATCSVSLLVPGEHMPEPSTHWSPPRPPAATAKVCAQAPAQRQPKEWNQVNSSLRGSVCFPLDLSPVLWAPAKVHGYRI